MIKLTASKQELHETVQHLLFGVEATDQMSPRMTLLEEAIPELAQLLLIEDGRVPDIERLDFTMYVRTDNVGDSSVPVDFSNIMDGLNDLILSSALSFAELVALAESSATASSLAEARRSGRNLNGAATAVVSIGTRFTNGQLLHSADVGDSK